MMTADKKDTDSENTEQSMQMRREKLLALADNLLKKRDEAVLFRSSSGVERRWRDDENAYDGVDFETGRGHSMIDYATGEAPARGNTGPARSRVKVNVIRGKCEIAEGRFADIMFPVEDRNWGLKPTPVPEIVKGLKDDRQPTNTATGQPLTDDQGNPVKTSDVARSKMEVAKQKMHGMENEIDDQLTECQYNAECRKVIRDAVKAGTGVLKGPNVIKKTRKAWIPVEGADTSVYNLQVVEEAAPASCRVDYWKCYPDPQCGDDVRRAAYVWEADEILPRELRSLIGLDGYFDDQIKAVLMEEPFKTSAYYDRDNKKQSIRKNTLSKGAAYEKWEYHGDVDTEDLMSLGIDPGELERQSLSACVLFVNERPIKIQLNVLDTGDIIYDFFQWTPISGSPWGIGVARMAIWWGAIIQGGWRAMLDNARDSSGANIVVNKGVEPADNKWEVTGKKIWRIVGDIDDAKEAFAQFQIANNQPMLQAMIEMALKFLDIETQIPMLFQGEKSESLPDVLGIVDVIVDSSNVALRSRVKVWDDQITIPHLTRYYHWNMQYNDNPDIKGDWNVTARGASVLLERDKQARALIQSFKLKGTPEVDAEIDWGKATRQIFEALRLDVLKSEEDKKRDQEAKSKQADQPGDPRIATAQIRAQSDMQKAQLTQQSDMAELKLKAQMAEQDRQHEIAMKQMDYKIKLMEFSQQSGLAIDKIKADLAKEASKQNLMRDMADKKTAQMTTPPVEPAGRAAPGKSFVE